MILNKEQVLDIMSETRKLGLSGKVSIDPSTLMDLGDTIEALEKALEEQKELWGLAQEDLNELDRQRRRVPFMQFHNPIGLIDAALEGREKGGADRMMATFTCAHCHGVFDDDTEEAEVNKEAQELWGIDETTPDSDKVAVCEDCFEEFMDWFSSSGLTRDGWKAGD